jgi:3-hydroxybutyryl-CoA dehydratase
MAGEQFVHGFRVPLSEKIFYLSERDGGGSFSGPPDGTLGRLSGCVTKGNDQGPVTRGPLSLPRPPGIRHDLIMNEIAYEDIKVDDEASLTRTITEAHIVNFAGLTGDWNPVHADAEYAAQSMFGERIAHGMLVAGLISAVLGTQLPGTNSIYLGQDLKFIAPVKIGDTVKVVVTVLEKRDDKRIIKLRTAVSNQRGEPVIDGTAVVKKIGR